MNFDTTVREDYATKAPTPQPAIITTAHEYVEACDRFDRLQQEHHKLNEEMRRVDTMRKELRERLLSLIAQAEEGPANKASVPAIWR